jgi:hypothetical protein
MFRKLLRSPNGHPTAKVLVVPAAMFYYEEKLRILVDRGPGLHIKYDIM